MSYGVCFPFAVSLLPFIFLLQREVCWRAWLILYRSWLQSLMLHMECSFSCRMRWVLCLERYCGVESSFARHVIEGCLSSTHIPHHFTPSWELVHTPGDHAFMARRFFKSLYKGGFADDLAELVVQRTYVTMARSTKDIQTVNLRVACAIIIWLCTCDENAIKDSRGF